MRISTCASLAALLWVATGAASAEPPRGAEPTTATVQGAAQLFLISLASGELSRALDVLDEKVVIYESGAAEHSRAEYAREHLALDAAFLARTKHKHLEHDVQEWGDRGMFLSRYEQSGEKDGKPFVVTGATTMLLHKGDSGWRITHIHWSSHDQERLRCLSN